MKILADAACDIQHAGFYLQGFMRLFGKDSLRFGSRPFRAFTSNSDILALVLQNADGSKLRLALDYGDSPVYRKAVYEWADFYAKTNIREEEFPDFPKSAPLGIGLPIRVHSRTETLGLGFSNYLKARKRIKDPKHFLSLYRALAFRNLTREQYDSRGASEDDYLHFVATIWKNDNETNQLRANFMRAVKSLPGLEFEGGYAPRADGMYMGFDDIIGKPFEPMEVYMRKTLRSLAVFNTPSVKGCHSWKLAEFLSWGKAIVSTPLLRMMPAPLVDGVHVLYTDGSLDDIREKIDLLRRDRALRNSIERNARAYYEEHLLPEKVVERLMRLAGFRFDTK